MKEYLPLFVLFLVGTAYAQEPPEFEIPCTEARPEAVTEVPRLIGDIASIKCTVYGHLLTGADGYLWNHPGAFAPVIVPAQMAQKEPVVVRHDYYFKSIAARVLPESEAVDVYVGFLEGFDERSEKPGRVLEIVATNQIDVVQKVYIFQVDGGSIWGYTCQTSCKPEMPFMVLGPFDK
jgi:hypothetical protein